MIFAEFLHGCEWTRQLCINWTLKFAVTYWDGSIKLGDNCLCNDLHKLDRVVMNVQEEDYEIECG